MRKNIEWTERLDDGVKLSVRVSFPGRRQVKWEFKRSDEDGWDSTSRPSPDQWETLEVSVSAACAGVTVMT